MCFDVTMTRAALPVRVAFALALVCVGCASGHERARHRTMECLLGHGFGEVITIEGTLMPPRKGWPEWCLRVLRIEGEVPPEGIEIGLRSAGSVSGVADAEWKPGVTYRLRGYESGAWDGVVHDKSKSPDELFDEWGPRPLPNFGFHHWFEVWSAEAIAAP